MNQTRLEVIKSIVTDTRHKRIIDELLAEIERLQAENKQLSEQVEDLRMEIGFWEAEMKERIDD